MLNNHENTGQNEKKKGLKILITVMGIFLIALFLLLTLKLYPFTVDDKEKYTLSDIVGMDAELESAQIHIEAMEGNEAKTNVEVVAAGNYKTGDINIETKENILYIKQTDSGNLLNIGLNSKLEVFVKIQTGKEATVLDNITVSDKSGKISVKNLTSKDIAIQSESGEIACENISSTNASVSSSSAKMLLNQINIIKKFVLETQSGEMTIKDIISDELSIDTKSGAINLENLKCNKLETKTESGSSHIAFSDELEKITAHSSSTSGSIDYIFQNDIPLNIQWTGKKMDSEIESDKNSANKLNLETDSGSLSINRK